MPDRVLSLCGREEISFGLVEEPELSWAYLGRRVGRHPTTIAREVNRNGGRHGYRPMTANQRAVRQRRRPRLRVLEVGGPLRDRIVSEEGLGAGRCGRGSVRRIW